MIEKIKDLIMQSSSIVLLTHEAPDGDAIGSSLAFYYWLSDINKDVDIIIQNVPKRFKYLKDINKIVDTSNKSYDLGIVLDCATKERIGQTNNIFCRCKRTISIDHHAGNTKYANLNYIEGDTPACCQIIDYLFKKWDVSFNKDIGEALMTGLLTDTSGFRNNNVDKNSYLMAAEMYDMGVNIYGLYKNVLTNKNKAQFELMKVAIDNLEFFDDGKIAFSYITKKDMENALAEYGDHEGLVDIGRNVDSVEVSIFIREDDGYRISLRSNGKVDVCEIALKFGGNGHKMASGIKMNGSFEEIKATLINYTLEVLNK